MHLHLKMTSILITLFHSAGVADASHDDEEQADDAKQADDGATADDGTTADGDEGGHYLPACHISVHLELC